MTVLSRVDQVTMSEHATSATKATSVLLRNIARRCRDRRRLVDVRPGRGSLRRKPRLVLLLLVLSEALMRGGGERFEAFSFNSVCPSPIHL